MKAPRPFLVAARRPGLSLDGAARLHHRIAATVARIASGRLDAVAGTARVQALAVEALRVEVTS